MDLVNLSPFPAEAFRQLDKAGDLYAVVAARGTFELVPDAPMRLAATQAPFAWEDVYEEWGGASVLVGPSDFVPYKPGTDVTVLAEAHAPDGRPAARIECGLRIEGRLEKRLVAHGPRAWQRRRHERRSRWLGRLIEERWAWELGPAEPVTSVPLSWALAVGGPLPGGSGEVHVNNPVGRGLVGAAEGDAPPVPAPRIEAVGAPVSDPHDLPLPAGFAPLAPVWETRLRHAGTYDERWLAERHPLLPHDFDPRFWQVAPPDQVATPHLAGHEAYALAHLHRDYPLLVGRLPGCTLQARVHHGERHADVRLALDGVHLDLRQGRARATLTWRRALPLSGDEDPRVVLRAVDAAGRRYTPRAGAMPEAVA